MMDCIQVTVCPNIWIVVIIMILILITSALCFQSISTSGPDMQPLRMSEAEFYTCEHNCIDSSDEVETLFEAHIYDLYVEFYTGMDDDELDNLENYSERE